ncbi:hypothetical protein D8W73_19555 [Citrobacter amalonaticus]|nr:hypothetical protein [Citrobacter amalonaticus]
MLKWLKYLIVRPYTKSGLFLHVTPIDNLAGIIIATRARKRTLISNIESGMAQSCFVNINPTVNEYRNLTMKGIGNNKKGYVYCFLNKISRTSLFLNLFGRHDPELNVCITISSTNTTSPRWYRWIDNSLILQGGYRGKAIIKRL